MIVESPTTHSNLDGPISPKFHTRNRAHRQLTSRLRKAAEQCAPKLHSSSHTEAALSSSYGNQTQWFAAFHPGPLRLVHRNSTDRPPLSGTGSGICSRSQRDLRAGCADGMAHPSARSNPYRNCRIRLGPAPGRANRGDSTRGRGMVRAPRKALAWGHANHGNDPHRHSGKARRQGCGLDGEGQRRTI
jgi:hypothetical protein